jgi:hypothetical protein
MAIFKTKQGALFIGEEATFGAGVAENDLDYIEVSEVNFGTLANEWRDADVLTQQDTDDNGMIARIPGERGFSFPMCGVQSVVPDEELTDPAPLYPPQVKLLAGVLGNPVVGGFGTAKAQSTTTLLKLDTGEGATFAVGQLVWVRKASGRVMLSRVKTISTDDLTVSPALPVAAAEGDLVIGGYSHAKTSGPVPSFELCYKGAAPTDVRRALGCVVSQATITAEPRGYPKMDLTFKSALGYDPDDCVAQGYAGEPGAQAWSYPAISQVIDGGLYVYSGTSLIKLDGTLTLDFGIELVSNDGFSQDDPNGIREWVQVARRIRIKVNPAYRNNDLLAAFKNPNAVFQLVGWWGTGVGTFGFVVPAAVLVAPANLVDRDGYLAQELEFGCKAYTGDTDPGELEPPTYNAPFVCGYLAGDVTPS